MIWRNGFIIGLSGAALAVLFLVAAHGKPSRFIDTPDNRQACMRDVTRFCLADIEHGVGAVVRCLRDNRDKLSPECASAFK